MATRIGINGFGRIGRYLVRLLNGNTNYELVAVNARGNNSDLAHLLKYDSVHGHFPGEVYPSDKGIVVNGKEFVVTRQDKGEWTWGALGVDLVIETSGSVKKHEGLSLHIEQGAKKVIMSAPVSDGDVTIVMGVNHESYDPEKHHVISAASCTTNCLAPVAKVLHDSFGINHGLITTIHSYTMSQRLLDGTQKDIRRARAAALSLIPTSTGAAQAVGLVIPELKGRLDGISVRVPTPNVSMVDLTCEMDREVTAVAVNSAMHRAAESYMRDTLGYSDEPLVSIDYNGDTHGGVVDALSTAVMDKKMVKMLIWYDNEAGFTNQLLRLMDLVSARL